MVKKLVLLIFSICFMLVSCEFVIRHRLHAWPFESALYVPDYLTMRDTTLRWRFSPSNGRNSLGLRNREVGPKKAGTYRILFLGDSLIWTGETSSGELYTAVLEGRLNSRSQSPSSFEIINAGIPGYTTYQELEFLKIYGIDMKPDLVILGFVFNDLYYKYLHRPTNPKLLNVEPTRYLYHFNPYAFPGVLFARSYLAHDVVGKSEVIWKRILHRPILRFEQKEDFYLAWKSYGWIHARKLIGETQALLRERGISLVVLVFPVSDQVNDRYRNLDEAYLLYPQGKIREICDDHAIPRLDLTESIYTNGGITLFRDYLHLNAKGNDLVTDELEKYLVEKLGL
jgi:lysophospholipase L1-like esterase